MSINISKVNSVLSVTFPQILVDHLLTEYIHLKGQFALQRWQPSELNGGRFGECVIRILEYLNTGNFTKFGVQANREKSLGSVENNTALPDSMRLFMPKLVRVMIDVRNRRNVAHVGGEVSPNAADSQLVCECADWIMVEIIRHYHACTIDEAKSIVKSINEISIPIVTQLDDGFVRIQNTNLSAADKVLVILYYKQPDKVEAKNLARWVRYTNISRFRAQILKDLDSEAMLHYDVSDHCQILPKGSRYVEKNIPLDLIV